MLSGIPMKVISVRKKLMHLQILLCGNSAEIILDANELSEEDILK